MKKLLFILFVIAGFACSETTKKPLVTVKSKLLPLAKEKVLQQMKAPSTTVFVDSLARSTWAKDDPNTYIVRLRYDSQNGFGAMMRGSSIVKFNFKGGDSLDIDKYEFLEVL